jgi:hypothetical protein
MLDSIRRVHVWSADTLRRTSALYDILLVGWAFADRRLGGVGDVCMGDVMRCVRMGKM